MLIKGLLLKVDPYVFMCLILFFGAIVNRVIAWAYKAIQLTPAVQTVQ